MRNRLRVALLELKVVPQAPFLLLLLALLLLGLTHGVIELASRWPRHFIENMESFMPLTIALISTPLLITDSEQGMTELNATLPNRKILWTRWALVWASCWVVLLVGADIMNVLWGPVKFWTGVWAALGPALFLTGLALWGTLLTARLAVGYLIALGLPVTDLILKILGAFSAVPLLQLLDTFSYRWNVSSVPWWAAKLFMLVVGAALIVAAIRQSPRYWSRLL